MIFCFLKKPKKVGKTYDLLDVNEETQKNSVMEDLKETFSFVFFPRMLYVQPMIIWSSISLTIYGSIFISLMTRSMENSFTNDTNE